jgi:hypothetical protein
MSSAVRHQPLRIRVEAPSVPHPHMASEAHAEPAGGLLASRAFWLGGVASVGMWTLAAFALVRLF